VTSLFHGEHQLSTAIKPWSKHVRYVGTMIAFGDASM